MNCLTKIKCITAFLLPTLCLGDSSPDPIPLDLSDYDDIQLRDYSNCDSCETDYTCEWLDENTYNTYDCCDGDAGGCEEQNGPLGAWCCDDAYELDQSLTCEVMETNYNWDCDGCECSGDEIWGCTDMGACSYNADATADDGSCEYAEENYDCDGNCIVELDECGVCNGDGIADGECDCDGNVDLGCGCNLPAALSYCEDTDGDNLGAGNAVDYCLADLPDSWIEDCSDLEPDCATNDTDECGVCGGDGADVVCWDGSLVCDVTDCPGEVLSCMDAPDICIWNAVYNNYDNQEDCEENGGIWGSYLEYFNTSCEEMVSLEIGCDIQILYWTVSELCPASCGVCCDDEAACNPNGEGSCEYAEENYDCDGNCIVEIDCEDVCGGGDGVEQECGCGSLGEFGIPDGDCDCDGNIDSGCGCGEAAPSGCDNDCGSTAEVDECGVCGGDGSEIECWDGELVCNESDCSAGIDYTLILDNHHNLVSFYALPEDNSVEDMMEPLLGNITAVLSGGAAAQYSDGEWIGSLTEITPENGYWISINNFPDTLSVIGFDMDPDRMYELYEGPNLISFPDSGSIDLSSAIPDDVEHLFKAIISEGTSALNSDYGWAGSLTGFQGGAGYWVIVQEALSFSYNTEDLLARSVHSFSEKLPDEAGFTVAQSSRQAFYYVNDIKLDNGGVEDGDWVLSYNNDVLAGIRQWKGNTVDIPNMGFAGDMVTAGYFNEGEAPTFKLLKQSTGKIITLEGNIPSWSDNGIFILGELYEKQQFPELFVLNKAYPNPFNPTTTIGFGLPDQSEIIIEIYNLYGKRVETLVDKSMPAGYSSVVWNADKFSSGLYFVKLSAHSLKGIKYTNIQKLMLVK